MFESQICLLGQKKKNFKITVWNQIIILCSRYVFSQEEYVLKLLRLGVFCRKIRVLLQIAPFILKFIPLKILNTYFG